MTDWAAEHERRALAHHEAAHAVVAISLQIPLWYCTIDPDDRRSLGEARLAPNWQQKTDLTQAAIFQLAGVCAERKFRGGKEMPGTAAHDMEVVSRILAV